MKKLYLATILVLWAFCIKAQQVPVGFNYQSIVRDALGLPVANSSVRLRISILEANVSGTNVYQEEQITTANQFGLVNLVVGKGTKTGGTLATFNDINWASNSYFVQVEVNINNAWVNLGVGQFQSVPYSMVSGNTLKIQNQNVSATAPTAGQFLRYNATTGQWEPSNVAGANGGTVTTVSGLGPINVLGDGSLNPQISISQAGPLSDGYLSSIDWAIFNGKLSATTTVGGDLNGNILSPTVTALQGSPVSTTTPSNGQILQWNGTAWEPASLSFGTVTSVSGIGPISVSNPTTTPQISISQASNLTDGFITASDYANFSLKQDPLTAGANITITGNVISGASGDVPVSLTQAGGTTITGIYPNFTISSPIPTAETNIIGAGATNVTGTFPNFTVNTPATALTGAGGTTITGTFPNFTIETPLPASNTNIIGVNGATVTGTFPNFTVDAPFATPQTNIVGAGATTVSGTFPNYTISTPTPTPATNLIGANSATVTGTFPNYTIDVQIPSSTPLTSNTVGVSITGNNFEIGTASGTTLGLLSSVDYNRFASKVATISGSNGITLNQNGNAYTIIGQTFTQTATTFTGENGVTVSGTGFDITIGGVAQSLTSNTASVSVNGLNFNIGTASGSSFGLLTPSDFSAFNNKVSTIVGTNGILVNQVGTQYSISGANFNSSQWVSTTNGIYYNTANVNIGSNTVDPNIGLQLDMKSSGKTALQITSDGLDYSSGIKFGNSTGVTGRTYGIYSSSLGRFHFADLSAGGIDRMIIDNNGNMGLGVISPNEKLTVNGNSSTTGIGYFGTIIGNNLGGASGSVVTVDGVGRFGLGTIPQGIQGAGLAGGVSFWNNTNTLTADGTNFFWDNTNKRLGVGTNTPSQVLHVVSNSTIDHSILFRMPNLAPGSNAVFVQGVSGTFANQAEYRFRYEGNGNLQNAHSFGFNSIQPFVHFTAAERVGIGVAYPNEKLSVQGNSSITGIGYFGTIIGNNLGGASGSVVTVDGAGRLGIGSISASQSQWITTTGGIYYNSGNVGIGGEPLPLVNFDVYNSTGAVQVIRSNDQVIRITQNSGGNFIQSGSATAGVPNSNTSIDLNFSDINNSVTFMALKANGNLAIGTGTNPALSTNKLDVNGSVGVGSYAGSLTAPTNSLIVSGSVGIGTATPNEKLTVQGNSSVTGTTFTQNLNINSLANGVLSVDGTGNVVIGNINSSTNQWISSASDKIYTNSFVGFGEINPLTALHVKSNSSGTGRGLLLSGLNAALNLGDVFGSDPLSSSTWHIDNKAGTFRIYSQPGLNLGGDSWFHIVPGGRVGIGQNYELPTAMLDIAGDVRVGTTLTIAGLAGSPPNYLSVNANGQVITVSGTASSQWISSSNNQIYTNSFVGIGVVSALHALDVAGSTGNIKTSALFTDGTNSTVRISHPSPTLAVFGANVAQDLILGGIDNLDLSYVPYMTLKANGSTANVGIGTTTPGESFVVVGNSSVTGIGYFGTIVGNNLIGASGSVVTVDGVGRLGIGTFPTSSNQWISVGTDKIYTNSLVGLGVINPTYPLQVSSNLSRLALFQTTNTGDQSTVLELRTQAAANGWLFGVGGAGNSQGLTSGQFYYQSESGNRDFVILNGTGKIGIGTITPNEKFTVEGNTSATGTTFTQNLKINALANGVLSVDGAGNVVLGNISNNSTNWISTTGGITFIQDKVGIGTSVTGTAKLKVIGDASAGGMVLASQTFNNVVGTPNNTADISLFKQVIYIPAGTLNIKVKVNAYNYVGAAPSSLLVKIGANAPVSQPVSSDAESTEVDFINLDVSAMGGTYQQLEILGRSSLAAESVLVKSYTVSIQD